MIKQVIIIRKDLNMRRGKEISQCCHASQGWLIKKLQHINLLDIQKNILNLNGKEFYKLELTEDEKWWLENRTKKITLQVNSKTELLDIYNKAVESCLNAYLVEDLGLTEFDGVKTFTCVAIGPNKSEEIDKITKDLKLY